MTRLRLASWAALAGLGFLSGCQSCGTSSCDPCGRPGLFNGGLMSRLRGHGNGTTVIQDGSGYGMPIDATPVSGLPNGGCSSCANGGPMLPPYDGTQLPPPGSAPFPGSPPTTLPAPSPMPPLAPVPSGNGLATPTPANPSSRASR